MLYALRLRVGGGWADRSRCCTRPPPRGWGALWYDTGRSLRVSFILPLVRSAKNTAFRWKDFGPTLLRGQGLPPLPEDDARARGLSLAGQRVGLSQEAKGFDHLQMNSKPEKKNWRISFRKGNFLDVNLHLGGPQVEPLGRRSCLLGARCTERGSRRWRGRWRRRSSWRGWTGRPTSCPCRASR